MSGAVRSVVAAGGVMVLVVASVTTLVVGTMPAASAAGTPTGTPTVVVTPDVVASGGLVEIETSGFPEGLTVLLTCTAAVVGAAELRGTLCGDALPLALGGALPPRTTVSRRGIFSTLDGSATINCATADGGCVVGVMTFLDGLVAQAYDAIEFLPILSGTPTSRNLHSGDTIEVNGILVAPGDWVVAQCGRAYVENPSPERAGELCGPSTTVTAEADGTLATELTVHDPLVPAHGHGSIPCGYEGCVIAVSNPSLTTASGLGTSFGPTTVTLTPSHDVPDGATIEVAVQGAPVSPNRSVRFAVCVVPVGPTVQDSRCAPLRGPLPVDDWGSGTTIATVSTRLAISDGDDEGGDEVVDCRVEPCGIGLFGDEDESIVSSAPLRFASPPSFTIEPSTSLIDGQETTLSGSGLAPGRYAVHHCVPWEYPPGLCEDRVAIEVGPSGTFSQTVPAMQRFPSTGDPDEYCRAQCSLWLWSVDRAVYEGHATYAMAEGELTVTPDAGLSGGDIVHVTGRDIQPTYPGPTFWVFPTGGWAFTQCDRAVLDRLDLLGVFTHCSADPPAQPVTVDGSTVDLDPALPSTITRILGGTTDCAAAPGACVVGLVRLEQDGSLSSHLVPVSFEP